MNKPFAGALLGVATLMVATAGTAMTRQARATFSATVDKSSADYKIARDKCDALSGNDKEGCVEEAIAAEKRAKADAKAQYKQTREAHTDDKDSSVSTAKATFDR